MTSLESWIVGQGLSGSSVASLLSGFAEQLVAEGVPVVRAYLALPTVNPTIRVHNHTWTRSTGTLIEGVSHERMERRERFTAQLEASLFTHMVRTGLTQQHWRFDEPPPEWFAVFDDVQRDGGKDYLARVIWFEDASALDVRAIAASFSTDRTGGFLPAEIARIDAVLPLLGLAAYRIALLDITIAMLDTYVGLSAGRRVLSGEIQRGSGATLTAALLFADLRGFTALADTADTSLIIRLNEHLEAMAQPVAEHSGDVLKFLGDGLLAVFPITDERSQKAACSAAVHVARDALARNEAVNRSRPGETPLGLDIALHCGEVYYGNIGAANRLDFTVIGPAVNEVSRMEALCGELGCAVLMSASVAAACPVSVRSLGRHKLRGVAEEQELFTLIS